MQIKRSPQNIFKSEQKLKFRSIFVFHIHQYIFLKKNAFQQIIKTKGRLHMVF